MEALVIHAAGDLRVENLPTPELGAGQLRVRVRCGGICGSDLHYYQHGGFGTVRLKEPMALGHEVSGRIDEIGAGVTGFKLGQRIAISPSRPCGACQYCQKGQHNHCLNMRFYGSAMPFPHIQGAFRESLIIDASQAHAVADDLPLSQAALAEPLSVGLHAITRAGSVFGKRVLVTGGAGFIGSHVAIRLLERGDFQRNEAGEHPDLRAFQMSTLVELGDGGPPVKVELDLLIPDGTLLTQSRQLATVMPFKAERTSG